jgi:hypothetical protein
MAEVESPDNGSRNRRTEQRQLMQELPSLAMSIEYDSKKEGYYWSNFDFDCGRVKEYLEQTYGEVQDSLKPTLYEICQEAFKVIDEFLKWALNDEQGMALFVQLEGRWDTVVRKFDMCMRSGKQQKKLAETGGNAIHAKLRKIWTYVKKIPRWIYVLVLFLAALLTCLFYLGWLGPIKEFIRSISLSK